MKRNEAEKILNNAMHTDEFVRVESEGKMKTLLNSNYPCFLETLGAIMADRSVGYSVRVMASIILKNGLHSKNRRVQNGFATKWCNELSDANRSNFIDLLKQSLGIEEKFILENVTKILGTVMRIETETGMNPTHFQWILEQIEAGQHVVVVLKILSVVCNQLYDETNYSFKKNGDVEYIYRAAVHYLNAEFGDPELHKEVLLCVWNTMDIFIDIFTDKSMLDTFMVRLGGYTGLGGDVTESALEALNKFIGLRHVLIQDDLPRIAQFYNGILTGDDEGLAMQAMDFWEVLADKQSYEWLFQEHAENLLGHMLQRLRKEELDELETTEHKAACRILGLLREAVGPKLLETTIACDFVSTRLASTNPEERAIGAMALACIYAKGHKPNDFIEFSLTTLVEGLLPSEHGANLNNTASVTKQGETKRIFAPEEIETYIHEFLFCIGKICERNLDAVAPKMAVIIENCGRIIFSGNNQVAASAAWAYSSLFHNIALAPVSVEVLYGVYKDIMLLLVNKLDTIAVADYDLRNALVSALSELILCYVDRLLPVFNDLAAYLLQKIIQFVGVPVTDKNIFVLEDLLSNYVPILILVLERPVQCRSSEIIGLFAAILRMPENKAHGEVFIGVSALATRITDQLPQLISAILVGVKSKDTFVMKAALNALADCATSLENSFDPYIASVIGTLVDAIAADTTDVENKSFIIDNLGDIALAIGPKFEPYLDMAIVLLSQVVKLSRHDNEDFVDNLRKSVVKLFNFIIVSIGNRGVMRSKLPSIIQLIEQTYQLDVDHTYVVECVDFVVDTRNIFGLKVLPIKWLYDISNFFTLNGQNYSDSVLEKVSKLVKELDWTN